MNKLLDVAIYGLQIAIVAGILTLIALFAVDAYIADEDARVAKLQQHLYDVALGRGTYGPAAPTGLRLAPTDKAQPKVTYFQDASERPKGGK